MPVSDNGAGSQVLTGRVRVHGWSVVNSAAAANSLVLNDGNDRTGLDAVTIPVAASSASTVMPVPDGVLIEIGIFAVAAAAANTGVLYVSDESDIGFGRRPNRVLGLGEAVTGGQGVSDLSGVVPAWHVPSQSGHG